MSANLLQATAKVVPMRLVPSGMFDMPGITFTPTGLVIKPGLKIDQWIELGKRLRHGTDALRIWLGDYIRFGKHEYGKKYESALALTGYKLGSLKDMVWVASAVPLSSRDDKLTFKHYRTAAPLRKKEVIKHWLALAAQGDHGDGRKPWSAARLGREIQNASSAPEPKRVSREMQSLKATAVREELDERILTVRRWLEAPSDAVLTILYQRVLEALVWQRDRTVERDCAAIVKVFNGEIGTEAPERASDGDISAWLHGHYYVMGEQEVDERVELMVKLKMLVIDSREGARHVGQKGDIPDVYAAEQDYFSMLQELDLLPAADRTAKLRRDWNDRLQRYAPELYKTLGNFGK